MSWEKETDLIEERNEILRSLDPGRMKNFIKRVYPNAPEPSSDEVMLASMHKLRYNLPYFNFVEKKVSELWLKKNNYRTGIF